MIFILCPCLLDLGDILSIFAIIFSKLVDIGSLHSLIRCSSFAVRCSLLVGSQQLAAGGFFVTRSTQNRRAAPPNDQ
jgi:hypothetical protein